MSNQQDCNEIREMLDAYHDGEAQATERELVERHLLTCEPCKRALEQIRTLSSSLRALPAMKLKNDIAGSIEGAIARNANVKEVACAEVEPQLDAYFDHELPEAERDVVAKHVSRCETCSHALADIDRVVASLKQLTPMQMKRDLAEEFEVVLAAKNNVVPFKRKAAWTSLGLAAMIALVVIAMSSLKSVHPLGSTIANQPGSGVDIAQGIDTQLGVNTQVDDGQNSSPTGHDTSAHQASASIPVPKNVVGTEKKGLTAVPKLPLSVTHPLVQQEKLPLQKGEVSKTQIASSKGVTDGSKVSSGNIVSRTDPEDVIALYDGDPNPAAELGITTDEDGLYAIKL